MTRRRTRSVLTVLAIAIAVGAMVALVGVSSGFADSFVKYYERMGVDLVVTQKNARQKLVSVLDQKIGDELRKIPGVKDVVAGMLDVYSFPEYGLDAVFALGQIPGTVFFEQLHVKEGRSILPGHDREIMLGTVLAEGMNKRPGDKLQVVEGEEYEIVGIFSSENVYENSFIVMPLSESQRLTFRPNLVTGFNVMLESSTPELMESVTREIESKYSNVQVRNAREHVGSIYEIQAARAMAWITTVIALGMGIVGIMNTMVMAVNERTREIGLLRAVGWAQTRIARMILSESMVMSIVGGVLGSVGAILIVQGLTNIPSIRGLIDSRISPVVMLQGIGLALIVGLVGGLVPALRAASLPPTIALRQE